MSRTKSTRRIRNCRSTVIGESVPMKSSQSMVCAVVEGNGTTQAGDDSFSWEPKDVFALPTGATTSWRRAGSGSR